MVTRRSIWQQIGPFDPSYQLRGQYLDFCVGAAGAGWKVAVVPEFEAVYPSNDPTIGYNPNTKKSGRPTPSPISKR